MNESPNLKMLVWARHGTNWKLLVDGSAFEILSINRGSMTARVIAPYEPTPLPDDSVGKIGVSEHAPDPLSEAQWCNALLRAEIDRLRDARPLSFWELAAGWLRTRRQRIRAANQADGEAEQW